MSIGLLLVLNTATCAVPELVPGAAPSAPSIGEEHYEWAPADAVVGITVHRKGSKEASDLIAGIADQVDSGGVEISVPGISKRIRESRVVMFVSVEGRLTEEVGKTLERIAEKCSGLIVSDREIIDEGGRTVARMQ